MTRDAIAGKLKRKAGGPPARDGAEVLLKTARKLFAEKGIDAVSLREIAREAGQRNNSALHYHFGSKEALIQAILVDGIREVDTLRNDFIDQLFSSGRHTELRALVEAIVWPMVSRSMARRNSTFIRFLAAAQIHPEIDLAGSTTEEVDQGFRRLFELMQRALPELPELVLRQRYLASVSFVMFSLADYERMAARRTRNQRRFDFQRALENLIDMVTGALAAPVSEQVRVRLAAQDPSGEAAADPAPSKEAMKRQAE